MATPLDIGLFQHFQGVFPFLFVLVITYAVLTRVEWFKEKHGIAGLIAFLLAASTLLSNIAIKTINMMMPWFVLFLIFGILMLLAYMVFGVKEDTIREIITGPKYGSQFAIWVIAIMLIIGLGSMFTVIDKDSPIAGLQSANQTFADGNSAGFFPTIFHPKILGMILIMMIAWFTVQQLTKM